jgi:hypothetical protein
MHDGSLYSLYCPADAPRAGGLLISAHVDSLYDRCWHRFDGASFWGTFDNSLPVCILLDVIGELAGLGSCVTLAFTGDEEDSSRGAKEASEHLEDRGSRPAFTLVLDVTAESGLVTVENCHPGRSRFLPETPKALGNFIAALSGTQMPVIAEADPDESWMYRRLGFPCASLCLPCKAFPGDHRPVAEWMHDDQGFEVSARAVETYRAALIAVCRGLAALLGSPGHQN